MSKEKSQTNLIDEDPNYDQTEDRCTHLLVPWPVARPGEMVSWSVLTTRWPKVGYGCNL